jgi:hypothetical protein
MDVLEEEINLLCLLGLEPWIIKPSAVLPRLLQNMHYKI